MHEDAEKELPFGQTQSRRGRQRLHKRASFANKVALARLARPPTGKKGTFGINDNEDHDIPEMGQTLANIFAEAQEMQARERQEQLEKAVNMESIKGGAGALTARSLSRRSEGKPATVQRRNVGEPRDTDFRGYESLQDILNSTEEWKKDEQEPESLPSRPSTVPAWPGGKPTRRRPQPTPSDKWNRDGHRIYPKFDVKPISPKQRQRLTVMSDGSLGEFSSSGTCNSGSSEDSSQSESRSTSATPESEGEGEITGLESLTVSGGWHMLLGFAKDGGIAGPADGGLSAGDDLVKWASSKDKPHKSRRTVNIAADTQDWEEPSREMPSPLRPGVYAGHGDNETKLLENIRTRKRPPGLPDSVLSADQAKLDGRKGPSGMLNDKRNVVLKMSEKNSKMTAALNKILEEEEDEKRHEDSRNYQAWRKKVIECARSMRLEVDRFQLGPKIL